MATPVILTSGQLLVDPTCKVLKAEDYAIYLEAQEIIESAKKQAEAIVAGANDAYEQEKQRGYKDGLDESKADQAEQMLKVVSRTINYLSDVEHSMADILLSGIRKIIGQFDQEELAVNLVRNALQHVRNEKQVTIRLAPSQYNMVKAQLNEILSDYKGVGFIDLVADQRLSTGDCIMESDIGVVDASVDVQLKALRQRFSQLKATAILAQDSD